MEKVFKSSKLKYYKIIILIICLYFASYLYNSFIKINKISIIIPTYNRKDIIINSIQSVLNQTYKNIEVIVIDDCSSDNTDNEINKIKDNRFRYIKIRKNKGSNYCRNLGIKKATGQYISFLDSDDKMLNNKLEKQIINMKINKSNFDFCKIRIYINNNNNLNKLDIPKEKQIKNILNGNIIDELCRDNFISTQSILVEKKILEKFLFDEKLPRLQDYDLALRIIPKVKVSFTNEKLVKLFLQKDSIGNSLSKLINAITILLQKNYNISLEQKKNMINYFNSILKAQK